MNGRSTAELLRDAKTYGRRAEELAGSTSLSLLKDVVHYDHALRSYLTILGEALTRVPDEVKLRHPEIAWAAIRGLRNRIVHAYWRIDLDIIRRAALDDVPGLIASIERAIVLEGA